MSFLTSEQLNSACQRLGLLIIALVAVSVLCGATITLVVSGKPMEAVASSVVGTLAILAFYRVGCLYYKKKRLL